MLKKAFKVVLVVMVGAIVINETKAGSHFRAWVERMTKKMEKEITPEMELARIKNEVGLLDKDIDNVKGDLAESNVNVKLLRNEIVELRQEVKDSDIAVRKHGEVIKTASTADRIQWGYRTVSYVEAKDLFQNEIKRYREIKERLKIRETALVTQESTRDLVEQLLQEMLKQQEELSAAVLEMEAEIKLAKVEQIRSKRQNDGSRMADIKKSLGDLKKRVLVQREKLRIDSKHPRGIAEEKSIDDLISEIDGPLKTKKTVIDDVKVLSDKE